MDPENKIPKIDPQPASFRDPSGFIFFYQGSLYRQVNQSYRVHYDLLINSGLYEQLAGKNMVIPHAEVALPQPISADAYKIIKPDFIPFISYPYEWCFSQLKDAALLTLEIEKAALGYGLTLKDASAYNIQFRAGRPILIDTLSFEKYEPGLPWSAYRQFCQHFLAPLALISNNDPRLSGLLLANLDGIPLDLASSLLPVRTRLSFLTLTHIHLHAKSQTRFAGRDLRKSPARISARALVGLIDSLGTAVMSIKRPDKQSEWSKYDSRTNYSEGARADKERIVSAFLHEIRPKTVWDLGANTGRFSRLAAKLGAFAIAFDADPAAVEINYSQVKSEHETNLLPLYTNLANPSPALGWAHEERLSLAERGPADLVMALALVHHLAIANNLPLPKIAQFLSQLGRNLIIEFVPKEDSNAQKLLRSRPDIFEKYAQADFETEFKKYFEIKRAEKIADSGRILYLMVNKQT